MHLRTLLLVLFLALSAGAQTPSAKPVKPAAPVGSAAAAVGTRAAAVSASGFTAEMARKTEAYLRESYGWGKEVEVSLGPAKDSQISGLLEVPVQVTFQGRTQGGIIYLTRDGKYIIQGRLDEVSLDPFADNRKLLDANDSPSIGPANAAVTVFEFSDFQCPHCKVFADALKEATVKYPQVRFIYKNFPLEQIHPWSLNAAIAARCAFKTSNDDFWKVSAAIFQNQTTLDAKDAAQHFKEYATAAGVPAAAYDACIADPATKAAVEKDASEGQSLGVGSTPTLFVNGHPLPGGDPQVMGQFIDYELEKTAPRTAPSPASPPASH